jgi:hypothetical protein
MSAASPASNDDPSFIVLTETKFRRFLRKSGQSAYPNTLVVISRAFIKKLLDNYIINKKNSFSGDVHNEANFPSFFLLHK